MNEPTILALDTASRKTGYAIYKNGLIAAHGSFTLKDKGESDNERTQSRISALFAKVCNLITKHGITQIVAEDIFRDNDPRLQSAWRLLGMCRGAIISANTANALPPVQFINPQRVKNEMWGYTSSLKSHRELTRE